MLKLEVIYRRWLWSVSWSPSKYCWSKKWM